MQLSFLGDPIFPLEAYRAAGTFTPAPYSLHSESPEAVQAQSDISAEWMTISRRQMNEIR
jgi:hypothetical protein